MWGSCFSLGSRRGTALSPPPPPPHSLTHSLSLTLSSLHHLSHLTQHSPVFTTLLITSHSSFTTLQYTTYHISLIIHHSSLHYSSHLTHHSPLFTTPLIAWQAGAVQGASWLPFAWQAQYTEPGGAAARVGAAGPRLAVVWQVQYGELPGCLWCGRRGTESFLAAFRVAGAVHRASWKSCGARGPRWPAAGCRVAGAITEPPGGAAARVGAAGPRLAVVWQVQYRELPGCLWRGRRSTQSFLAAFGLARAVHRASWRSCGARGRRWPAAGFRMAGAVQRASWLPFAWQAQNTEPPGGAAARVGAAGPRLAFAWQVQYRELPGCLWRGRRRTQSLLEELRRAWAPLARGWLSLGSRSIQKASCLPFAWQAQYTEPRGGAAARVGCGLQSRFFSRLIITTHHRPTYHIKTSHHKTHHNSSHLITYQVITAPLLTPHSSQLHC